MQKLILGKVYKSLAVLVLLLAPCVQAIAKGKTEMQAPYDPNATYQVILLRHGESLMNVEGRTSGWGDTHLTEKGSVDGLAAGELLKQEKITFDIVYSSALSRAIKTAWQVLEGMDKMWIPIHIDWKLNETNQGAFVW